MNINRTYLILLSILIIACTENHLTDIQQRAASQVKTLIDNEYLDYEYVQLYEVAVNDSSHIYRIVDADSPIGGNLLQLPSKVIKYKDKYLCFIELDEPEMSIKQMKKLTHYSGNPLESEKEIYKWYLGLSKYQNRQTLVDASKEVESYFDYTELWPYFSGYVEGNPVQMGIFFHDVRATSRTPFPLNVDSVRKELIKWYNVKNIYGEIYLKNNTDSTIYLSSLSKSHCAIINNQDTLYLTLSDSLPIKLMSYERKKISYESIPNDRFFKRLSSQDPWTHLYNLFCTSTYSLMKINHKSYQLRMMHLDCVQGFWITDESERKLFLVFKKGIYDDMEREQRIVDFWWKEQEESTTETTH